MNSSDREYRNRIEIIRDILEVLCDADGACKTDIVYGAKINFNRLDRYTSPLIEKNLINEREGSTTRYYITGRGRSMLKQIEEVVSII